MSLCTWRKLIKSKKQDCLLLVSFCLVGFWLQKLFYSEQSKHQFLHRKNYQCITKKLRNDKKRFKEKISMLKSIPTNHQRRRRKKSIFLLKVIFVKNTVLGKNPSTTSREYIRQLQPHSQVKKCWKCKQKQKLQHQSSL